MTDFSTGEKITGLSKDIHRKRRDPSLKKSHSLSERRTSLDRLHSEIRNAHSDLGEAESEKICSGSLQTYTSSCLVGKGPAITTQIISKSGRVIKESNCAQINYKCHQ